MAEKNSNVRLIDPNTGEIAEVRLEAVDGYIKKGARFVKRMQGPNGEVADVADTAVPRYLKAGAKLVDPPPTAKSIGEHILTGVATGAGLPSSQKELNDAAFGDPVSQSAFAAYDAIHDGRWGAASKALGDLAVNNFAAPFRTVGAIGENLWQTSKAQFSKAKDALDAGDPKRAMVHLGGGLMPMIAPGIEGLEKVEQGQYAEGGAQFLSNVATLGLLGQKAPKAAEIAANLSTDPVIKAATVPKRLTSLFSPGGQTENLDLTKAAASGGIQSHLDAERVMGKPIESLHDLEMAGQIHQEANRAHLMRYNYAAEQRGVTIKGDTIADAMNSAIDKQTQQEFPTTTTRLQKIADSYRGKTFKPSELEAYNQKNNAALAAVSGKEASGANAALLNNAKTAMRRAAADETRNLYYKGIDQAGMGESAAELQRRYGQVAEIQRNVRLMKNKLAGQPEEVEKPWVEPSDAVAMLTGGGGNVVKKFALKSLLRQTPASVDAQIKSIFDDARAGWSQTREAIPEPPGAITDPSRLLERGPIRGEAPDTTKVTVTTGKPIPPSSVVELKPTERGEFIRQNPFDFQSEYELLHGQPRFEWPVTEGTPYGEPGQRMQNPTGQGPLPLQELLFPKEPAEAPEFPNYPIGGKP